MHIVTNESNFITNLSHNYTQRGEGKMLDQHQKTVF